MTENLIVDEEYIQQQASYLKTGFSDMDRVITGYIACLNTISRQSVLAGATADALDVYIGYAQQLKDHLKVIGANTSNLMQSYLEAVDDADQYLF